MRGFAERTLLAAAAVSLGGGISPAQAATALPSLKDLLSLGYEIKDVSMVTPDVLTALGLDPKAPQVIVTLQRGSAIASCEYLAANWFTLAAASIEGTTQCDIYPK